jgi:hypothetical protein
VSPSVPESCEMRDNANGVRPRAVQGTNIDVNVNLFSILVDKFIFKTRHVAMPGWGILILQCRRWLMC